MKKLVLNVYSDPMHLVLQPDLRENLQDVNLTCCLFEEWSSSSWYLHPNGWI